MTKVDWVREPRRTKKVVVVVVAGRGFLRKQREKFKRVEAGCDLGGMVGAFLAGAFRRRRLAAVRW